MENNRRQLITVWSAIFLHALQFHLAVLWCLIFGWYWVTYNTKLTKVKYKIGCKRGNDWKFTQSKFQQLLQRMACVFQSVLECLFKYHGYFTLWLGKLEDEYCPALLDAWDLHDTQKPCSPSSISESSGCYFLPIFFTITQKLSLHFLLSYCSLQVSLSRQFPLKLKVSMEDLRS